MSQPVCYMRYGNAGQLYRTCNNNFGGSGTPKPPAVFTPLITPQEFADKIGKSYEFMSSSQKQNYHRLASARSMRERRLEEKKQSVMNKQEYKDYLQSKKQDTKDNRENKTLINRKVKEEKELQKSLRNEGAKIGDKGEIKEFIENEVIPARIKTILSEKFKEDWVNKEMSKSVKEIKDPKEIGIDISKKESSDITTPNGLRIGMNRFIKDFKLDNLHTLVGLNNGASEVKQKIEKILKVLYNLNKITDKKTTEQLSYNSYRSLFNRLITGDLEGDTPSINSKIEKAKSSFMKVKEQLSNEGNLKKKREAFKKEQEKENKEIKKKIKKQFDKHKKEQLDNLQNEKKSLIGINLRVLEEARNIARKNNLDEKWIKKNINLGIDEETGMPNNRIDLLNKKLIRAKDIIENIEGIDQKLILSRELKRKK